jgi:hypothetical protein
MTIDVFRSEGCTKEDLGKLGGTWRHPPGTTNQVVRGIDDLIEAVVGAPAILSGLEFGQFAQLCECPTSAEHSTQISEESSYRIAMHVVRECQVNEIIGAFKHRTSPGWKHRVLWPQTSPYHSWGVALH